MEEMADGSGQKHERPYAMFLRRSADQTNFQAQKSDPLAHGPPAIWGRQHVVLWGYPGNAIRGLK